MEVLEHVSAEGKGVIETHCIDDDESTDTEIANEIKSTNETEITDELESCDDRSYESENNDSIQRREIKGFAFHENVRLSLQATKAALENVRKPKYSLESRQTYNDKFGFAEFLTNLTVVAVMNVLERLGLDESKFQSLLGLTYGRRRSVTLRLSAVETCSFIEEKAVPIKSRNRSSVERKLKKEENFNDSKSAMAKVPTKVTEYRWKFKIEYRLFAFFAEKPEGNKVVLADEACQTIIITRGTKAAPKPRRTEKSPIDISMTWFIRNIAVKTKSEKTQLFSEFSINRSERSCATPRGNDDINEATVFFSKLSNWCLEVSSYFLSVLPHEGRLEVDQQEVEMIRSVETSEIFVPALPLFEEEKTEDMDSQVLKSHHFSTPPNTGEPVLPVGDINFFLKEHGRSLDKQLELIGEIFSSRDATRRLLSETEESMIVLFRHAADLCTSWFDGIGCIEVMLRRQLAKEILSLVSPGDFMQYARKHQRELFREEIIPKSFCYSLRRPGYNPIGMLSISCPINNGENEAIIETFSRKLDVTTPLSLTIDDATSIEVKGERHLHAWITHDISTREKCKSLHVLANARQFSSFLLVMGKMTGPNSFDPVHAIILENKDELLVPLLLEQIPTHKEYQEVLESLSPEEQRFAVAFRNKQLESSLFSLCIIHLKPQLEVLLQLPKNALLKETRLTEDLIELFSKYQIPSDILSYRGDKDIGTEEKLSVVKEQVAALKAMITESQEESKRKQQVRADICNQSKEKLSLRGSTPSWLRTTLSRSSFDTTNQSLAAAVSTDNYEPCECINDAEIDLTTISKQLDYRFQPFEEDSALRPTVVKTGSSWTKTFQENIIGNRRTTILKSTERKREKDRALDLLDALSESGTIPIECADVHVLACATHCFDKSIVDTVFQDTISPLEKLERSMLVVASIVHGKSVAEILRNDEHVARVTGHSPLLMSSSGGIEMTEIEG